MVDKENLGDNSMSSKPVGELHRGSSFPRDHHILCSLGNSVFFQAKRYSQRKTSLHANARPPRLGVEGCG